MKVDVELLKKYNRPGPRYTSYPTAVQFGPGLTADEYAEEIRSTNQGDNLPDLSLYFHLPFCKSLCYFCGCTMLITHNPDRIGAYLETLAKEIRTIGAMTSPKRKVVQLHWGGGTPSYLSTEQTATMVGLIKDNFTFADDAEVGVEIDPRNLPDDYFRVIRELGFNRVSFGIQDFNEKVQKAVNRVQPEALNRWVVSQSHELGFDSVNIDLIYGLPHQTTDSFNETIDKVVELDPDRLAVFNYAHVPWLKRHQRVIPEDKLPSAGERLRLLKLAIERLTDAGYTYLGMDHFAKADDDLTVAARNGVLHRNFQGYTTHGEAEIYAMGMSSISQLKNVYAQNEKDENKYRERVDRGEIPTVAGYRLNADDQVRRFVIMQIMCNNVVRKDDVRDRYGVDFDGYFTDSLDKLGEFAGDDLLELLPDRLQVSEEGRLVIRNIAMAFDNHLERDSGRGPTYSRTV
jgi:oxygen-independent coproporphyrinogen-3 oxidase